MVGTRFDPMLAKVIAHGADRAQALARLRAALWRDLAILGVTTNVAFLASCSPTTTSAPAQHGHGADRALVLADATPRRPRTCCPRRRRRLRPRHRADGWTRSPLGAGGLRRCADVGERAPVDGEQLVTIGDCRAPTRATERRRVRIEVDGVSARLRGPRRRRGTLDRARRATHLALLRRGARARRPRRGGRLAARRRCPAPSLLVHARERRRRSPRATCCSCSSR